MESISAIRNRKKKPKKFSYEEAKKEEGSKAAFQERHRSIRQMKENLLERKNPFEVW